MLQILFLLVLLGSCGTALLLGRGNERSTAIALLASALASPLVETSRFTRPEAGILLVDALLLGFLVVLALRSDRFWPLWAAGFQVVGTLIHVARLLVPTIWPLAYATAGAFWAYPVLIALALGTWWEGRFRAA